MPRSFCETGLQAIMVQCLSTLTSTLHFMTCYCSLPQWIELKEKQWKDKNIWKDSVFPSTRRRIYKAALWILTQITLPTPPGMKTKWGERTSNPGHRATLSWSGCFSLYLCHLLPPLRRNSCTDRWDVQARTNTLLFGLWSHVFLQCLSVTWGEPGLPPLCRIHENFTLPPLRERL